MTQVRSCFFVLCVFVFNVFGAGAAFGQSVHNVSSLSQLQSAINSAVPGDQIILQNGSYTASGCITVGVAGTSSQPILIAAQSIGGATIANGCFTFNSPAVFDTVQGFVITNPGTTVLNPGTNHIRITRNVFDGGTTGRDVDIDASNDDQIDHNNFQNKTSSGQFVRMTNQGGTCAGGNSLRIWVHHNYFFNDSGGTGNGGDAIENGGDSTATANDLIEFNRFEQINSDPEVVSNKSADNIIRYNTLLNNEGGIVLRDGNNCQVYGNFIQGSSGVGIRFYGDFHLIYNNYITGAGQRAIDPGSGTNADHICGQPFGGYDQPDHVQLAFNTLVNNANGITGETRGFGLGPAFLTVANNIIQENTGTFFQWGDPPTSPTFEGNIIWGSASIGDMAGYTFEDPQLVQDGNGIFHISSTSPAINASVGSFSFVTDDMDGQPRDTASDGQPPDVGADEFSTAPVTRHFLSTSDVGPNAFESDFSISATPSSQTVAQGASTNYSVTVATLSGTPETISFSVSGLPSGASASFNPTSVSNSGSSTLNVLTSSSTPAGTYTLTITGASNTTAHSTTVSLTVNAPSDFSISAAPSSQTVTAGGSTSYTTSVSAINGFTGTVSLSVSGAPTGVTCGFNPTSISGGSGSATLTCATVITASTGTVTLTITGTSGGLTHSTTVSLTVNPPPPPDFSLSATPGTQTVTVGGSTSYTASVTPLNGFSGTVSLSVSGLPSGATGTLNPTSTSNGSGSSTLSISTTTTATTGSFTLTITGTSGGLTHSTTVTLTINPSTGLPAGWSDSDIGSPAIAGSASFSNGVFTVNGSGSDIWSTSDQFNYASQSLTSDMTITARVASQQNTNLWAKSGVMIRETTAANSSFVHVFVTPGHGVNMQYRNGTGVSAVQLAQIAGPVAPYWVRLVRSGSTFTGFASADGVTWTQVGAISVTMASSVQVGLAVTSHNTAALNTSTFDNVTVSTPAPDFVFTASPSSQTVTAGSSSSYTASVSPLNSYSGTVNLSASVGGSPAGVTASFTSASISGGSGSSTLNITTSSSTPMGTYTITISGTDSVNSNLTHSATVTLVVNPVAPACVLAPADGAWHDTPIGVTETGTFTATFDATPSIAPLSAGVGISQGAQTAYSGFANIVIFATSGVIQARNGGSYQGSVSYTTAGQPYHFRLAIDVPSHTYSIFVTPPGGTEQTVGSNFAFRTEQSTVTSLDTWGALVNTSPGGTLNVCNFAVQ